MRGVSRISQRTEQDVSHDDPDPIYLDYNATTPVAPRVADAVARALTDCWGNPSSAHAYGRRAREAVEGAREQVANLLGCHSDEIVFTSGGTESDNAAIVGIAEACADRGRHVVVSSIEHQAIEEACGYLETRGWEVTRLPVDGNGCVRLEELERVIRTDTVLISLMHANNETGVVQPVDRLRGIVGTRDVVIHCDAAQSVGKLPIDVDALAVDALTLAGHKLYAPKGVGALYLRRGTPFAGFLRGAGHERGLRAGTENVPEIVGLGVACEMARRELPQRREHLRSLRDRLESELRRHVPDLVVHGGAVDRLPNTLHVAFPGADAVELLAAVPGVASAGGAACHSGQRHVSATLKAMGVEERLALCTLRLTVGTPTTEAEIDEASDRIGRAARRLRDTRLRSG